MWSSNLGNRSKPTKMESFDFINTDMHIRVGKCLLKFGIFALHHCARHQDSSASQTAAVEWYFWERKVLKPSFVMFRSQRMMRNVFMCSVWLDVQYKVSRGGGLWILYGNKKGTFEQLKNNNVTYRLFIPFAIRWVCPNSDFFLQ